MSQKHGNHLGTTLEPVGNQRGTGSTGQRFPAVSKHLRGNHPLSDSKDKARTAVTVEYIAQLELTATGLRARLQTAPDGERWLLQRDLSATLERIEHESRRQATAAAPTTPRPGFRRPGLVRRGGRRSTPNNLRT
jgi:hypothetical protein